MNPSAKGTICGERKRRLKALSKPKVDPADLPAALLRQEARGHLRGLGDSARMKALTNRPDPVMIAAALEAPPALSGLTAEMRGHVEAAYLRANHAGRLRAMDDHREALSVVHTATEMAMHELRSHVGMAPHEFDQWFATADEGETRKVA